MPMMRLPYPLSRASFPFEGMREDTEKRKAGHGDRQQAQPHARPSPTLQPTSTWWPRNLPSAPSLELAKHVAICKCKYPKKGIVSEDKFGCSGGSFVIFVFVLLRILPSAGVEWSYSRAVFAEINASRTKCLLSHG